MSEHDKAYEVVDHETHEFQAGDTFQQVYDITFPSWFPNGRRDEILERLLNYATDIENALDNEFSDATELSVQDTSLVSVDDTTERYFVTYHVDSVGEGDELTPAGIWFVIYAVLIILGLVGIAWILRETRLLLETPGGSLALAGLLAVGAYGIYAYRQGPKESEPDPTS